MTETEKPANNRIRLTADYQMMGDEPGYIWADIVFGDAKDKGIITGYEVLEVADGPWGLQYVLFTVDVAFEGPATDIGFLAWPFTYSMTHVQAKETGEAMLNAVIGDSDVSCRWAAFVEVVEDATALVKEIQ